MNLKVKEVLTNLKNFDFDALGNYKMEKREAEKLIDGLRWIPVTERHPDNDRDVLVVIPNGESKVMATAWYSEVSKKWTGVDDVTVYDHVLAWMELPESYQE